MNTDNSQCRLYHVMLINAFGLLVGIIRANPLSNWVSRQVSHDGTKLKALIVTTFLYVVSWYCEDGRFMCLCIFMYFDVHSVRSSRAGCCIESCVDFIRSPFTGKLGNSDESTIIYVIYVDKRW